ncbi:MAG: hypothetical protein ACI8ZB_004997 [Desulforhopalus sp.]
MLYSHLNGNGFPCIVAKPSMISKKIGVRNRNDDRDAISLARLLRAGELTAIYVPDLEDEAMRDLTRARNDTRIAANKAKQRLHSFLLRNDCTYGGKTTWIKAHFNWLATLKMLLYQGHIASYPTKIFRIRMSNCLAIATRCRVHIFPYLRKRPVQNHYTQESSV